MIKIRVLREEDKIEELGKKICRLVDYHEHRKGRFWEWVALIDVLFAICRILKSYDKRIKELEGHNLEHHEINETGGINKIKIILDNPILKEERRNK